MYFLLALLFYLSILDSQNQYHINYFLISPDFIVQYFRLLLVQVALVGLATLVGWVVQVVLFVELQVMQALATL